MYRSYLISRKHYAYGWKVSDSENRNDRIKVNKVAYEFATTKDASRREKLQLWLLKCFHGYLIKYLNMIIFGQLPILTSPQGKDSQAFLKLLLNSKKNKNKASLQSLRDSCKTLHLAFKEQPTTDEVYDVLVLLFLKVCAHYDPLYPKKTEKVCKYIDEQPDDAIIKTDDISASVEFDSSGCIRVLVRGNYIESVPGPRKTILGYKKGPEWPPAPKFFQISSMGFTGFAQRFFRWYLRNYILEKMGELESTEHVLQLDHMPGGKQSDSADGEVPLPNTEGNWTDSSGQRWSADIELMERWKTLDVSHMDEDWVLHTNDFLFKELSQEDRRILYLVFVKELNWTEISELLQCDAEAVSGSFNKIMMYLESRSKLTYKISEDV